MRFQKLIQVRNFEKSLFSLRQNQHPSDETGIFNSNQQDAQEALSAILDGVHTELIRRPLGTNRVLDINSQGSVVSDCFLNPAALAFVPFGIVLVRV